MSTMKTKPTNYELYKKRYIKKHKTLHGLMSEATWEKRNKRRTRIFAVADFETTAPDNIPASELLRENRTYDAEEFFNVPKSSVMFLCGFKFNIDEQIYITYENMKDFFDKLASWSKAHSLNKLKVYFHNLKFDGSFILSYLLKHNFRQTLERNRFGKPVIRYKQFQALISSGKWFSLEFMWSGVRIQLLDSLKLNPNSLRKIGESYKMYKGEADYSKFKLDKTHNYPSEWIEYLKQDVRITESIIINHLKHGESLDKMTIGSCAYAKIKGMITKMIPHYTIKRYRIDEKGYFGGQCIGNPNIQGKWIRSKGKIRTIDAKSMYPSQMIKPLPYGKPLKSKPKGVKCAKYYQVVINQADIKPQYKDMNILHVPTFYNESGKRYKLAEHHMVTYVQHLECGEYTYYLWEHELKMLNEIYDIDYDIVDVTYYRVKPYLKEIVQELYINKRDCTDEVEKLYWKLIVNALYGKTGMKPIRPMDFYGEKWAVNDKYTIKGEKDTRLTINNYPALLLEENKKESDKANPVFLAGYITSLARVCLNTKIKQIIDGGNMFLYCDTDSVFFIENKPIDYNIGEELGQWGWEKYKVVKDNNVIIKYKGDGFISLAPKHYRVVCDHTKYPVKMGCAGCSTKDMINVLNQDYNYQLILDKPKLILGDVGYIVGTTEYNFRKYAELIKVDKPPKEFIWKN